MCATHLVDGGCQYPVTLLVVHVHAGVRIYELYFIPRYTDWQRQPAVCMQTRVGAQN